MDFFLFSQSWLCMFFIKRVEAVVQNGLVPEGKTNPKPDKVTQLHGQLNRDQLEVLKPKEPAQAA